MIVNEAFVRRLWPGVKAGSPEPLGRRLQLSGNQWREIVGVLADVKHDQPDKKTESEVYVPFSESIFAGIDLLVRAQPDVNAPALLRAAVRSVDGSFPIGQCRSMDEIVSDSIATPRFYMRLMALFAALAAALAAVGIYGLIELAGQRRIAA